LKSHPDIESQFYVSSFCENDKNEPGFINNFKIPYVSAFGFFNKISFNRKLNAQIRSIYFMNERSFILSTNQGFLKSTFKQNISTSLDDNPFFKEELLRFREGYVEGSDSAVYFLGYPGIIRYKNNKVNVLDTNQFKTKSGAWINNRLYCIAEGRGLVSYNPEKKYALQQHVTKDLSSLDSLTCLFKLNDSELLLFGNQKTLIYQAQEQNSILLNVPKGLTFQKVVRDEVSGNFFGITHNELVQFSLSNNHLTFTVNSRIKLNFTKLNDLLFLPSTEEIWISDSEGIYIYRLNKQKKIEVNSVSEKIFSSEVFALVTDEKNRVWASTRFGVQVFNRKNGRSFFVSKPHGVINAEFYPRSAFKMRNGDLIFGGLSSYELMKPKFLDSLNYSKDFFLSAVQITRKSDLHRKLDFLIPQDSTIKLLTGKEQITVYLTNPDFIESSNYKFEFRINDNQWSHVGVSNSVFIADLPYGDHVLQIKMLDPFGNVVSFREIKIESIVSFYQRNEFLLLLIILLLVSVVIIVYTYKRINRVAAETKERIAMDLHDESGTVLTRLNMLIAAKNDLSNDREYLISSLNEALFSLRIFIFSFSNQKLKITNLEDGIKEFLQKTLIQTNIKWRVSAKVNKDHFISGELYRDIKLCVFEAINNIMKHAQCENVLIELISDKKVLTLKITDDGILENTDHLTGKGNGISNLKKRTKRNQGTCSFYILDERKGLTVELKFPIQ
ncbi:MAG: sensor histidine kinase, partial [Bacteroidota bacterium]